MGYMEAVKPNLDRVLVDGGGSTSVALPEATLDAFHAWLQNEIELIPTLLANAANFGSFAVAMTMACVLQQLECKHLRRVCRLDYVFPSVEAVRSSRNDATSQNVAIHFFIDILDAGRSGLSI